MVKISVMDLLKIIAAAKTFNKKFNYEDKKLKEIEEFLQRTTWDSYVEETIFIDELPFKDI